MKIINELSRVAYEKEQKSFNEMCEAYNAFFRFLAGIDTEQDRLTFKKSQKRMARNRSARDRRAATKLASREAIIVVPFGDDELFSYQ
jgi:hypothetical protein